MNKKRVSRLLLFLIIIFTGILTIYFSSSTVVTFLSKSQQAEANTLLVEGWLPMYAMEKAADEFYKGNYDYIITSGLTFPDYFILFSNSSLNFHPEIFTDSPEIRQHTIDIKSSGSLGGKHAAHFNVLVNDSLIADFYTGKQPDIYSLTWEGSLNSIDSVCLQFDNDAILPEGDPNLYIHSLTIDSLFYDPHSQNVTFTRLGRNGSSYQRKVPLSFADEGKERLIQFGI